MGHCEKCNATTIKLNKTLYGEHLCNDCWFEYILSDRGLVEQYVNIAEGIIPISFCLPETLERIITCWRNEKEHFDAAWVIEKEDQFRAVVEPYFDKMLRN